MIYSPSFYVWLSVCFFFPASLLAEQDLAYIVRAEGAWLRENPSREAKKGAFLIVGWPVRIVGEAGAGWLKVRTETWASASPQLGYVLADETSLATTAAIGVRPYFGVYSPSDDDCGARISKVIISASDQDGPPWVSIFARGCPANVLCNMGGMRPVFTILARQNNSYGLSSFVAEARVDIPAHLDKFLVHLAHRNGKGLRLRIKATAQETAVYDIDCVLTPMER